MRFGLVIPATMLVAAVAVAAAPPARDTSPSVSESTTVLRVEPAPRPPVAARRAFSIKSLGAEVDARVLANLLVDTFPRNNGVVVSASAGEVNRCENGTCHVPLTVKISEATGPVALTFAVANSKGVLSDVQHAECGTGACTIDLILEKGRNTLSLGAIDGVAQTSGFKLMTITASRPPMAGKPKTELF
jgi:hypothetical protein